MVGRCLGEACNPLPFQKGYECTFCAPALYRSDERRQRGRRKYWRGRAASPTRPSKELARHKRLRGELLRTISLAKSGKFADVQHIVIDISNRNGWEAAFVKPSVLYPLMTRARGSEKTPPTIAADTIATLAVLTAECLCLSQKRLLALLLGVADKVSALGSSRSLKPKTSTTPSS